MISNQEIKAEAVPLFELEDKWQAEWHDMPEFSQEDLTSDRKLVVHFRSADDVAEFSKLIGQRITAKQQSIWYPEREIRHRAKKRYIGDGAAEINPQFPIYIVSKGRWESRLTSRALEMMHVPYHIVVEPQEYMDYAAVIDPAKILVLPFSNLGQGSIPARNWIWEHSIEQGATRHWILDDNIAYFDRLNGNLQIRVTNGAIFRAAEDFVCRYTNVALAGFQYDFFAISKEIWPAFALNTRIYSCILIDNSLPYRWRGRYNEDTDLSIRALKDGWCTVLFYAFIQEKATTMTMKGGNMDQLYQGDGRLQMAQELQQQHPDIVKVSWKFNRWQHQVDYGPFKKNKLIRKPGLMIPNRINNYGMILQANEETSQ